MPVALFSPEHTCHAAAGSGPAQRQNGAGGEVARNQGPRDMDRGGSAAGVNPSIGRALRHGPPLLDHVPAGAASAAEVAAQSGP